MTIANDKLKHFGTPEVMDAVATGLGGLTAVLYGVFKK